MICAGLKEGGIDACQVCTIVYIVLCVVLQAVAMYCSVFILLMIVMPYLLFLIENQQVFFITNRM